LQRTKHFGCGNFSIVGPIKGKPGAFGHWCLFCGSYRCNRCRNPKLKKVRAAISRIASEKELNKMATLTLDTKLIPKGWRSDRYMRDCWRKMRVYLSRMFPGRTIHYVGVLEFTKKGTAHLHLLLHEYIKQGRLAEAWSAVGGGIVVDIRAVDVHRVSAYLSVYFTGEKIKHTLTLLAVRARIFTTSRSIRLWPKKEKRGCWLRRVDIGELFDVAVNPVSVRWESVEDLKPFGLEMLASFESPPSQMDVGKKNIFDVLRVAVRSWNSSEKSGDVLKTQTQGENGNA
jgi:hypothetical protein